MYVLVLGSIYCSEEIETTCNAFGCLGDRTLVEHACTCGRREARREERKKGLHVSCLDPALRYTPVVSTVEIIIQSSLDWVSWKMKKLSLDSSILKLPWKGHLK